MLVKLMLIGVGGAMGALLRYAVAGWAHRVFGGAFPVGTLAVNMIGCGLIGVAAAVFASPHRVSDAWRLALLVGLLGGFTTFSTYAYETIALAEEGQNSRALLNILLNNALGLFAAWAAFRLTQRLYGV